MIPQVKDYLLPSRWTPQPTMIGDVGLRQMEIPGKGVQRIWTPQNGDPTLIMPRCHNSELLMLMVERFMRADAALGQWAEEAKLCIDFLEGKQWSAQEIKAAEIEDRPLIKLNKIATLVRLVLGYHRNNRVDTRFLPTDDTASNEAVATMLTKILKILAEQSEEEYIDTEVFLDGITTGRGYYDYRLNFDQNDFGDILGRSKDPFTIRPDPDADSYDPDDKAGGWGYFFEARWASIDEIEYTFGEQVSALIMPLVRSPGYRGGVPSDVLDYIEEKTPWRTFGGNQSGAWGTGYMSVEAYIANSVDPLRKNIRLIECQHKIRVMQRNIVDLETGDREPIPDHFTPTQIQKLMAWSFEQYAMRGQPCPLRIEWRPTKRVRWTTMIGDIIVHDDWSPYESYTLIPYFPYFRRGQTRGMINDLLDPQREINKRRSSEIDTVTRVAHSGWMWHKDSLDEGEKEKIETHGGAPGFNLEWKGNPQMKPERIEPGTLPTAIKDLERSATLDLKEIAGINDSALGQIDRVQSGRAIEARTKQSILGIEMYMDNKKRTKKMASRKKLQLVQNHYTEPRLYKMQGQTGTWEQIGINQRDVTGQILNNVTIGRYGVSVDETPLSSSFLSAQFDELMVLVEKGILPIPMVQDIAVDLSTAPQKELLKARLQAYLKAQGFITPDEMVIMQAQGFQVPPHMLPPNPAQESGKAPGKKNGEGGNAGPTGASPSGGAAPAPAAGAGAGAGGA